MDNLQKHYLSQYAAATERALNGDIRSCLNTCFELRLKPDLALYTRAMVGLTICNFVEFKEVPEKLDIAIDALRLATELKVCLSFDFPGYTVLTQCRKMTTHTMILSG